MARKNPTRRGAKTAAKKKASPVISRARKRPAKARKRRAAARPPRAMSELSDREKLKVFAAVQQTLLAQGVGNTLAEIQFASDELSLVCRDGQVRRVVVFRCGAGVCTKNVCVPLNA